MRKLLLPLLACLLSVKTISAQSNFGDYKSYHFFFNSAIADNKQYGIDTSPRRYHWGIGAGASVSINDDFNLLLGLNYMLVKPNNTRSDYTFCTGASCLPISVSNQLFLPVGVEYYGNTDQSPFQMFYALRLVPAFSVTEVTEVIPFDEFHIAQPSYELKNNGFKFQDLQVQIAINNEFSINQKYKIYVEPSLSHSILFRSEDVINPDYMISLKVGFKIRTHK